MSDDSDGEQTPRVSESYNVFEAAARELAARLEQGADDMSLPSRPYAYDRAAADRARQMARSLRQLAARFAAWPTAHPETVAFERMTLPGDLLRLNREGEELLAAIPKTWPPKP